VTKYPAGHVTQVVSTPPSEYLPPAQSTHDPVASLFPGAHPAHVVSPVPVAAAQWRQPSILPTLDAGKYFPIAQGTHSEFVSPSELDLPAAQFVHASCALWSLYCPTGHVMLPCWWERVNRIYRIGWRVETSVSQRSTG